MTRSTLRFLSPLFALLLLLAGTSLASASSVVGTAGWTNVPVTLHAGPGAAYDVLGDVEGGLKIRVERCTVLWCQISTGKSHGWALMRDIGFGQQPGQWLIGQKFTAQRGGTGSVCFYEGRNFTGNSVCAKSGTVVHDLVLFHADNTISSVTVGDGVSVTVCRDRNLHSYCQVLTKDEGTLNGLLDNGISSYRVY